MRAAFLPGEGLRTAMTATEPTGGAEMAGHVYKAAAEARPGEAVVELAADGTVVSWSATAASLTETPAEAVRDESITTALPGLFPEGIEATLADADERGRATVEGWCDPTTGQPFWGVAVVAPLPTDGYAVSLRDETRRKQTSGERELLANVAGEVAQAESFVAGINTAIAEVCNHTEWTYGEAWVPDEDDAELTYLTGHAADDTLDSFAAASETVTFPVGEGLPGRVYDSGTFEWIPDVSAEPTEVFHRTELAAEVGLRAALGVPITTDDGVVAVLTFFLQDHRETDERLAAVVNAVAADLGGLVERKRIEDTLEHERALLGRIFTASPVGLVVTDTDGRILRSNREAAAILGGGAYSLTGETLAAIDGQFCHPDGTPVDPAALPDARALDTGETVDGEEFRLQSGEDECWLWMSATPIHGEDGVERVTIVIEDITDRTERERSLRAFREAIEQAGHSMYLTDTDGTIEYVNPAFEEMTGYSADRAVGETPHILNSGEHDDEFFADLWSTIESGDVWTGEVTNERQSGERYVVNQTIAPITDENGTIERYVAVNDDITEQKRRERTVRRQRNSLERLKQIIESLRPINRALTRADTRTEITRVLCEQLAASDAYLFAWVGTDTGSTDDRSPQEWAGVEDSFVEGVDAGDDLFRQALTTEDVQASQEVPTDPGGRRRDRAIEYGFQSVAAVPVTYRESVLGVIGVYSARPDAFDRYERGLLRELGERVGHALNAVENRQLLHTDQVVELEFDVGPAASPLVRIGVDLHCQLSVENLTPTTEPGYLCHVDVDGTSPARVVEYALGTPGVESGRVVRARGKTGIVELRVCRGPLTALFERGATISSFETTEGSGRLVAETTPQSDPGALIDAVEHLDSETTFVAKRTQTREQPTLTMTQSALDSALTDRQREVLELAYHAGYFESPRESTGDELAETLDISAATVSQHVRTAIRKLLVLLIDADHLGTGPTV